MLHISLECTTVLLDQLNESMVTCDACPHQKTQLKTPANFLGRDITRLPLKQLMALYLFAALSSIHIIPPFSLNLFQSDLESDDL